MTTDTIERTAWLSDCGRYRHSLGRHWHRERGFVLFTGLNPSTADAEQDDPTIRRCIRFARDWDYGGMEMCNLFDWRATDPSKLPRPEIAVSEFNDPTLKCRVAEARLVVAAWGRVPRFTWRIRMVMNSIFSDEKRWHCLGMTKAPKEWCDDSARRFPRHPLYVPAATRPVLFW